MKPLTIVFVLVLFIGGIAYMQISQAPDTPVSGAVERYFASPQASVPVITRLLKAKDWQTLASYYDLSGSDVDTQSLKDGSFFLNEKRPQMAHPAGFWRIKQPFAPGYVFQSAKAMEDGQTEVTVMVEIDEGGGLVQRGYDTFRLVAHPEGYQLLPKKEAGPERPPAGVPGTRPHS